MGFIQSHPLYKDEYGLASEIDFLSCVGLLSRHIDKYLILPSKRYLCNSSSNFSCNEGFSCGKVKSYYFSIKVAITVLPFKTTQTNPVEIYLNQKHTKLQLPECGLKVK